jgi:hypothetical protein
MHTLPDSLAAQAAKVLSNLRRAKRGLSNLRREQCARCDIPTARARLCDMGARRTIAAICAGNSNKQRNAIEARGRIPATVEIMFFAKIHSRQSTKRVVISVSGGDLDRPN